MAGDRIKTDRRDAEKLARSYRSGDLSPVWVPDGRHASLRDLVRAREAAKKDELRARHRLGKYLLRYGQRPGEGCQAWTAAWWQWVRGLKMEHAEQNTTLLDHIMEVDHQAQRIERLEGAIDRAVQEAPAHLKAIVDALQSLRGVAKLTAITLATEFGTFERFERASEVMSYTGLVPSERSSGARSRRGAITKTGNTHLRRVLVESAWHYRRRPHLCLRQRRLQNPKPQREATGRLSAARSRASAQSDRWLRRLKRPSWAAWCSVPATTTRIHFVYTFTTSHVPPEGPSMSN